MKLFLKSAAAAVVVFSTTLHPIDLNDTAAVAGAIHFGQTKFDLESTYSLDGEWHFFWHEFISPVGTTPQAPRINLKVRGTWKKAPHPDGPLPATGWGSYRLVITLGQNRGDLALRIPNIGTSYKLFANGAQIAQVGIPSESEKGAVPRTIPVIAPLPLPDADGRILLVMHVSNYDDRHGGIWQTMRIGHRQYLENSQRNSYTLSSFLFGAIFIIGLHHFLLFLRHSIDRTNLAFALLCVLLAVRPLAEGGRYLMVLFPEMPWILNSRLAYLTFYGSLPLAAWFLRLVFPAQFHRIVFRIILFVMLPVVTAVLFLPPRLYTETLTSVQIFSLLLIIYSIVAIIRAIRADLRGARTLAFGITALFIAAAVDILTVANILNLPEIASFGLIAFILSQSVLISLRQEDAYHSLEKLAKENKDLISSMELKILERTATVAELSAEGDAVLNALTEGVFLINREKSIGNKFSRQVFEILEIEAEQIMQRPFSDLIQDITGASLSEDARLFLNVLFNPMIDDDAVRDLNPLNKITIRGMKTGQEKIIQFNFSRQRRGNQVMAAFVSCKDITTDEKNRAEIEEREIRAHRQLEIVRTLFSVSPEALQAFYGSIETEIEDITIALGPEGGDDVRVRIENIYRAAHTIKGSAQLFKVQFIADEVHTFENKMQDLLGREVIENMDMFSVNMAYAEMEKSLSEFEEMILKILKFQKEASGMHMNAVDLLRESLPKMVAEICQKIGKKARLRFDNFSAETIPRRYASALRDALVQCVRNSLAHSIESPEARLQSGKDETGDVLIAVREQNDNVEVIVRDNGISFDTNAIRSRAIERNLKPPESIDALPEKDLINFIFETGFSTARPGGSFSGRGAGMDVIAKKIKQIGGKIRINWAKGQFTEFTFVLPKK